MNGAVGPGVNAGRGKAVRARECVKKKGCNDHIKSHFGGAIANIGNLG